MTEAKKAQEASAAQIAAAKARVGHAQVKRKMHEALKTVDVIRGLGWTGMQP